MCITAKQITLTQSAVKGAPLLSKDFNSSAFPLAATLSNCLPSSCIVVFDKDVF